MKHDYTHIIIVLDASGSMSSIQDDIKGSFNEFLKKQREEPGKTVFDLFQFNDEVKRTVKSADLAKFHDDLMSKYDCSGCTALNDAVCTAIDTVGHTFADMEESEFQDIVDHYGMPYIKCILLNNKVADFVYDSAVVE